MSSTIVPIDRIRDYILILRGQKVILDIDLAELYGVKTKVLNQAVTRNEDRFPKDFMFRLTTDEFDDLKSQIVTSSSGGTRYLPRAFTEQGVAMLSSVLRSKRAVQVNKWRLTSNSYITNEENHPPADGSRGSSLTQ